MDSVFDQFTEGNYSKMDELTDKMSTEQRHELAQLMVALADVTEKTRHLMEWVYQSEVAAAANSMMIFKTDANMMSTIIGNYLCYSYSCIRWLKFITVPLVEFLESQQFPADSTTDQGVKVLLKASEITLDRFFGSVLDVPLWLRQACMAYQVASNKKFGVAKGNPRPPGLLCGYLNSVLTTEKNAVIGEVSFKVRNGLRAVAGLLLQLGYQFGTITNPTLESFIALRTPDLSKYYDEFVNSQAISICEQVLASSKPKVFAKDIRLRTKRQRFAKMMLNFANPVQELETSSHASTDSSSSETNEIVSTNDALRLLQKMDYGDWRHSKTLRCGAVSSTWRSDDSHTLSLKMEMRVQTSLVEAAACFSTKIMDPEMDSMMNHSARTRISENVHNIYGYAEYPWPLGNRSFSYYQCELLDKSKNQVLFVYKHAPYPGPKRKGLVESKTLPSGIRLMVDPHDSGYVHITVVIHTDPGGSIPNWFINRLCGEQITKYTKIAKHLEDESGKKRPFPVEIVSARHRKI